MGYGIAPYSVPLARLRASVGSGSERLVAQVLTAWPGRADELDAHFRDEIRAGASSAERAVRALVAGTAHARPKQAFMYVYALEFLCFELGVRLSTNALERPSSEALTLFDETMSQLGVRAFRVKRLIAGVSPIALPRHRPPPFVSCLERAELASALRELRQIEPLRLAVPTHNASLARGVRAAIAEAREWLLEASARRGHGLVCFYY